MIEAFLVQARRRCCSGEEEGLAGPHDQATLDVEVVYQTCEGLLPYATQIRISMAKAVVGVCAIPRGT